MDWTVDDEGFDYIVGNPPYVSAKDMDKSTLDYIRRSYRSSSGMTNMFEAFIEKAVSYMNISGRCCFIVPNSLLSSRNSRDIRSILSEEGLVDTIIDYSDTPVFAKAMSYSCIILLTRTKHKYIRYSSPARIEADDFRMLRLSCFGKEGLRVADETERYNIRQIERFSLRLGDYMRMQVCTFYDSIYLVEEKDNGYYTTLAGEIFEIEAGIVRPIYKVSDFSRKGVVLRYIIFPYNDEKLIDETVLSEKFPSTYRYLCSVKDKLTAREKGKPNPEGWYAYGRRQGLRSYNPKILYPNYMAEPSFVLVYDDALFINGGCIIENGKIQPEIMVRILNSTVMTYYLKHKSKAIRGGYFLCNKTAIGKFSVPKLSEEEKELILSGSNDDVNEFLIERYGLIGIDS